MSYIHLFIIFNLITSSMTEQGSSRPSFHRVVYQTFVLSDGSVQCYGTCTKDIEDPTGQQEVFESKGCEGNQLRLSCLQPKQRIRIESATVGRLSAEEDICKSRNLFCSTNITNQVKNKCGNLQTCIYKIPNRFVEEKCDIVKYLSLDIKFYCGMNGGRDGDSFSTISPSSSPIMVTIPWIQQTIPPDAPPTPYPVIRAYQKHDNKFFWLLTIYSLMTDKDFISKNKAHMSLAIILSIFVGLVVSLFFILDHSRRAKRKRLKMRKDAEEQNEIDGDTLPNNNSLKTNGNSIEMKPLNGCLKEAKEEKNLLVRLSTEIESSESEDEINEKNEDDDIYCLITRCDDDEDELLFKSGKKLVLGSKDSLQSVESVTENTLLNLPPPPVELLESNSLSSSTVELIPPPLEFINNEKDIPSFVVTCPTPNSSCAKIKSIEEKKEHCSKPTTKPCLKTSSSANNINPNLTSEKKVRYPSSIMSFSDTCSTPRKVSLDYNNDFMLVSSQMDNSMNRSKSNNMLGPSLNDQRRNESPLFQMCPDGQETDSPTKPLNRNIRKGKLHVISKDKTNFEPLFDTGTVSLISYNKDEDLIDLIEDQTSCDSDKMTLESLIMTNKNIDGDKDKQVNIEESGYQSRETGTDSICSSNRSTDYEDFHVFSPTSPSSGGILKNNGRPKSSRHRERNSKRETDVANVKVLTKVARRMRYENTRVQTDLRPSESSMEDTSSRDSITLPRTRLKSKRRDVQIINDCTKKLNDNMLTSNSNAGKYYSDADIEREIAVQHHLHQNIVPE